MMSPDNPDRAADAISRLWERFDPEFTADGLGLAVPGTINRETGCIENCDHPCFGGDALIKTLRKRFVGKYFHVAPRVQMAAVSENFGGAANLESNFLLLELGETLEAMLYLNNRCFTGSHGRAAGMPSLSDAKTYQSSAECHASCRSVSRTVPRSSGRQGGKRPKL